MGPKQWLPVGLLLLARLAFAVETPMPEPVQRVLQAHGVDLQRVGIYVRELDSQAPLVSINSTAAFNPASAIKLLTTWLALSELGPHWTWPTEVYLDGDVERGVLPDSLGLEAALSSYQRWPTCSCNKQQPLPGQSTWPWRPLLQ